MSAGTIYSNEVTNFRASPQVMNNSNSAGGKLRVWSGTYELPATSADDVGDKLVLAYVPSNASVKRFMWWNDDLGTTVAANIGVYTLDGTVKDEDAYASSLSLASANTGTDIRFESAAGPGDIAKINNAVWQDAGYTTDPGGLLAIVLTISAGYTSTYDGGTVTWCIFASLT